MLVKSEIITLPQTNTIEIPNNMILMASYANTVTETTLVTNIPKVKRVSEFRAKRSRIFRRVGNIERINSKKGRSGSKLRYVMKMVPIGVKM